MRIQLFKTRLWCITLFSALFTASLTAQVTSLPYRIERLVYFGKYAEARKTADSLLQLIPSASASDKAYLTYAVAYVAATQQRYTRADSLYSSSLDIFEKNNLTADSLYLLNCFNLSGLCRIRGEMKRAETLIKKGLSAADRCKGTPHEFVRGLLLQEYAEWDSDMSRFQNAKLHYAQAIAFYEQLYGKKHLRVGVLRNNYANFLNGELGETEAAEAELNRAEKILKAKATSHPLEYCLWLKTKAEMCDWSLSRYKEVIPLATALIEHSRRYLGPEHPMEASALRILASHYRGSTPYFFKADTLLTQAQSIILKHFGTHYGPYIGCLQDKASWLSELGRNQDATQVRETALKLTIETFGENSPSAAQLMLATVSDLENEGRPLVADSLLIRLQNIYEKIYGKGLHHYQLNLIETRANIHRDMLPEADSLHHVALRLADEIYGSQSKEHWAVLERIAQSRNLEKKYHASDSIWDKITRFRLQKYGAVSLRHNSAYQNSVYSYATQKRWDEARAAARTFQENVLKCVGDNNYWYILTYYPIIRMYTNMGDTVRVAALLDEYEAKAKAIFGLHSNQLKMCYNLRHFFAMEFRTPSESIHWQQKAIDIDRVLGGDYGSLCFNLGSISSDLYKIGKYQEGESALKEAGQLALQYFGKASNEYRFVMQVTANTYLDQQEFDKALLALDEYTASARALGQTSMDEDIFYLYSLSKIQIERSQYKEVERNYKKLSAIPGVLEDFGIWNMYGIFLTNVARFREADSMLRRGLVIREESGQNASFFYNNISVNYTESGEFAKSLEYMKIALEKALHSFGPTHPEYAEYITNYAIALKDRGFYLEADSLFQKAMTIIRSSYGLNSLNYADQLNAYAVYLNGLGRFQEAVDSMDLAMHIYRKKLGSEHPKYIYYLENQVAMELSNNNWSVAEEKLRFLEEYWRVKNPVSSQYASILGRLASFHHNIGQYDKSIAYNEQKKNIIKVVFGEKSVQYATVLDIMGRTWEAKNAYAKALECYEAALGIDSLAYGPSGLYVGAEWYRIGRTHLKMNALPKAEKCLLHALKLRNALLQGYNTYKGLNHETLAELYEKSGKLEQAEQAARLAVEHQRYSVGEQREEFAYAQQRLASIMFKKGAKAEAAQILEQVQQIFFDRIKLAFGYLSLSQQQSLVENYRVLDFFPSMAFQSNSPELAALCYNNALLLKNAILQNSRTLREVVSKDPAVLGDYDQYILTENTIAALKRMPEDSRAGLDSLLQKSNALEKRLMQSPAYKAHVEQFKPDWKTVQDQLKSDEAAVEFIRYNRFNTQPSDTIYYAALVLKPNASAPEFIPLPFSELELEKALGDNESRRQDYVASLYNEGSRGFVLTGKKGPLNLFKLIWQPLEAALGDAKKIYYAPTGLLHRLNMNALPCGIQSDKPLRLQDKYKLVLLRSTRNLPAKNTKKAGNKTALLAGGIDFGSQTAVGRGPTPAPEAAIWNNLNASGNEVETCASLLTMKGYQVNLLQKNEASAGAFLAKMQGKPALVHAATHAYFAPDPQKSQSANKRGLATSGEQDPLQRSALVFAGANNFNDSLSRRKGYLERGYLTAKDIAAQDLRGTELVVLSACETGLGDLQNNEGVFGLQRAFLQAGARYVLMSLWEVEDASSAAFMKYFYQEYIGNNQSVREAFERTQKAMREKYADNVFNWGAFILIE